MNIIVLTSMRTGSTWLCNLISILIQKPFGFAKKISDIGEIWKTGRFVKAHHFSLEEVFKAYPDAYVINVVRNPKGRTSSQIFFKKIEEGRVEQIIRQSVEWQEQQQFARMWEGFSSRRFEDNNMPPHYIWTTFEWMKYDPYLELEKIAEFLDFQVSKRFIKQVVDKVQVNSREIGNIRKGRKDSWKEESFSSLLSALDKHQEMYYNRVNEELVRECDYEEGEII